MSAAQKLANNSPAIFGDNYNEALELYCYNSKDVKILIDDLEEIFHVTRIAKEFYCQEDNPIILWFRTAEKKNKKSCERTAQGIGSVIQKTDGQIRLRVFSSQKFTNLSIVNSLCTYDRIVCSKNLPNVEELADAMF